MKTENFYENIKKEILDGIKTMKDCGVKCNKLEINPQYVLDMIEDIEILKRALELCVNVLQREIDGDYIKATEVQAIYEIGKDYFIEPAKKEK